MQKYNIVLLLKYMAILLLFVFVFLYSYNPVESGDVWWHLSAGRYTIINKSVPKIDPFPGYGNGRPWIQTHWLGSVILYFVKHWFGISGLKLFRSIIFLLVILISFNYCKNKIPYILLIFLLFTSVYGFSYRIWLRPLLFNFIFIQLFYIILLDFEKKSNPKFLYLLPVFGVIWGNLHLGSFLYGLLIISIFLLNNVIGYLNIKFYKNDDYIKKDLYKTKTTKLILVFLGFLTSLLISPYGIEGLMHPIKVFLFPDYINFHRFHTYIMEMKSPIGTILSIRGTWFYILFICGFISIFCGKERRLLRVLIFIFATAFYLSGNRGSAFFSLSMIYVIADSWSILSLKQKWENIKNIKILKLILYGILITILSVNILHIFNRKIYHNNKYEKFLSLDIDKYNAFSAIKFLKKNNIKGLILNTDTFGGQIIWEGYPDLKPFLDGRMLNRDMHKDYYKLLLEPDVFMPLGYNKYKINIILLDSSLRFYATIFNYLSSSPEWDIVYNKGSIVMFARKDNSKLFDEFKRINSQVKQKTFSKSELVKIINQKKTESIINKIKDFIDPPPEYVDLTQEGLVLYNSGYLDAGLRKMIQGIKATDSPESKRILGMAYKHYISRNNE